VWPSGRSAKAALGGLTEAVIEYALVSMIVGMPAASSCLAISPTDWWQTGQTGTNSTMSGGAPVTSETIRGAVTSSSLRTE